MSVALQGQGLYTFFEVTPIRNPGLSFDNFKFTYVTYFSSTSYYRCYLESFDYRFGIFQLFAADSTINSEMSLSLR